MEVWVRCSVRDLWKDLVVGKERIIKTNFLDCEIGLLDTEVSILCDSILCDSICDQSSVYHNRRLKSVLRSQILISFSNVILYKKEQSVATASVFKTHGSRVKKSSLSNKRWAGSLYYFGGQAWSACASAPTSCYMLQRQGGAHFGIRCWGTLGMQESWRYERSGTHPGGDWST